MKTSNRKEMQEIMLELGLKSTDVDYDVLRHFSNIDKDPDFDYNCIPDPPEAFGR